MAGKHNIAEFAVELEATPGTAETIVVGDVLVKIRDGYTITPDQELIDLDEVSSVSTQPAAVIGRRGVTFAVDYVLRGPGDLTTDPAVSDLWLSALFTGAQASTIAIGAIAGGPYFAGETITGTTSAGTGLVLQRTADSALTIPYLPLTGALVTTETLTGSESAATSTSSAGPIDGGYAFRPADWQTGTGHHVTCKAFRDGYQWTGRGCLSDLSFAMNNGGPCIVTQNFLGALTAQGDAALFGVTTFPESTVVVPKFLNATIVFGTFSPNGIVDVNINWPTNPTFVEDANDPAGDGIVFTDYNRDIPTVSLEVDQELAATYDFFGNMQAGTLQNFELTHGAGGAAGSRWTFSCDKAQFRSIGVGNRDPQRATFIIELGLTGSNNEELLIWQH